MAEIWERLGNLSSIITIITFLFAGFGLKCIFKSKKKKNIINNKGINTGVIIGENNGNIKNQVKTGDINAGKK